MLLFIFGKENFFCLNFEYYVSVLLLIDSVYFDGYRCVGLIFMFCFQIFIYLLSVQFYLVKSEQEKLVVLYNSFF